MILLQRHIGVVALIGPMSVTAVALLAGVDVATDDDDVITTTQQRQDSA